MAKIEFITTKIVVYCNKLIILGEEQAYAFKEGYKNN